MNIGVLGTGMVGNTIGSKLIELGHSVKMGSRTATNEKAEQWAEKNGANASYGTFADAAAFGEIIFNLHFRRRFFRCIENGRSRKPERQDHHRYFQSTGFFERHAAEFVCTSQQYNFCREEIQKAYPDAKVVKTLNTMNCMIMVNPGMVAVAITMSLSAEMMVLCKRGSEKYIDEGIRMENGDRISEIFPAPEGLK